MLPQVLDAGQAAFPPIVLADCTRDFAVPSRDSTARGHLVYRKRMKRRKAPAHATKTAPAKNAKRALPASGASDSPPAEARIRFIERPNGVYWRASGSTTEYGPFDTLAEAEADALGREDPTFQATESVAEAEAEIGISEWIDPDTGVPAEESVPRIEDH